VFDRLYNIVMHNKTTTAAATMSRPPPILHTLSIEIAIDADFVEDLVHGDTTFSPCYSGYWAHGAAYSGPLGWLVCDYVAHEGRRPTEDVCDEIAAIWRSSTPLPASWYRLDRAAAIRAWCEGVKRWGIDWWYKRADALRRDVVLQLALLGEVRYG
jgi:hypothetical protein